jgi:hypothetical protein
MEIEFDSPNGQSFSLGLVAAMIVFALLGLGWLGHGVTRTGEDGRAAILTWSDYQVTKLERKYLSQKTKLRSAVDDMARLLARNPSPMEAQIHLERIEKEIADTGDLPGLVEAREAVRSAAAGLRSYSLGSLSYEEVAGTLNYAAELLAE